MPFWTETADQVIGATRRAPTPIVNDTRRSAWDTFVRYADQTLSLTDCTSFATMRSMHLSEAFTFDRRDFAAAGFVVRPD